MIDCLSNWSTKQNVCSTNYSQLVFTYSLITPENYFYFPLLFSDYLSDELRGHAYKVTFVEKFVSINWHQISHKSSEINSSRLTTGIEMVRHIYVLQCPKTKPEYRFSLICE